jgi:tRNA (cmo5U34)-methyltransferase
MSTHSVQDHLRVPLEEYDLAIRRFVPHYDEMLQTGLEIVARLAPADARLLDLGAGTGRWSQAALLKFPSARLAVLDVDPAMLEHARARLSADSHRVRFLQASFFDPLPASDVVVASLSLHHVSDLSRKTAVYASIREALAPGGLFLSLDAAVSDDPRLSDLTLGSWTRFMGEHGISEEEARGHLAAWAREERYFPVHEELAALERAGFRRPECFWRRGPVCIIGGLRA